MSNTPSKAEIEALVKRHGATSYRNRADTQHPAYGFTEDGLNGLIDEVLAKWGTPAVAKWAPEEIADGERGIRWVTNEGIHGRPTDHDVRKYLKQTPTARGCHCDECKQFYTTPQPAPATELGFFISGAKNASQTN